MQRSRLITFGVALALAAASLSACGGGGGGSTPSVSSPVNPAGATPVPSTGPSTSPSTGPSTSPSPTPSTGQSPTPQPSSASPQGTIGPQAMIYTGTGETNGSPQPLLVSSASNTNGYSGSGNLRAGDPGAAANGGGQGGTVDGVQCEPTMSNYYHVHFFVGIYYTQPNGSPQEVSVPAGVGMVNPVPPTQNVYNGQVLTPSASPTPVGTIPNQTWQANCFYDFHVHDNSGMIHVETSQNGDCGAWTNGDPSGDTPTDQIKPCNYPAPGNWTLQTFLDIWGITISPENFGPLKGPVLVYTTPPGYNSYSACPGGTVVATPCYTQNTSYQQTSIANALQMPLYSHTTFWILVNTGTSSAANLPTINWVEGDP